ncbi:hypothetical protein [Flexivirga meconopsidis]|uniref:hypothetical protein n=1 Tax=Flexivirga meconopsidis TaxID=2977121 RepID=UPI00223F265D|nr:hypothetical protein [Flexivirga meconopsidis]
MEVGRGRRGGTSRPEEVAMMRLAQYALACIAPAAVLLGCERAARVMSGEAAWPWQPQPGRGSAPDLPVRPVHDIAQLTADLTRLYAELGVLRTSSAAARVHRLKATTLAYDDVLETCCRSLQLDDLPPRPWSAVDRLEVEASLESAGLRW